MKKLFTQAEIIAHLKGLDPSPWATYSESDAIAASQYMGCSFTGFSESLIKKTWNMLKPVWMNPDYQPTRVMTLCGMGVKALDPDVKNIMLYGLNNDSLCDVASRAIVQHRGYEWDARMEWGSIADYYFIKGSFKVMNRHHIIVVTMEDESKHYKHIDKDPRFNRLPYYQYCIARAADFVMPGGVILVMVPASENKYMERFDIHLFSHYTFDKKKIAQDIGNVVYTFKKF